MKLPNRRKLITGVVVGLVLVAAGVVALGTGVFKEPDTAKYDYVPGEFERSIERVIPGVLIARLEQWDFHNSPDVEGFHALISDVEAKARAEGLMHPDHPGLSRSIPLREQDTYKFVIVAYGAIVGPDGIPGDYAGQTSERGGVLTHRWAREWLVGTSRQETEHLYNRESMTEIVPGVLVGRLELASVVEPLSDAEKEALRNDVIALAKAEGLWDAEHCLLLRTTMGDEGSTGFSVEVKGGPIHIAYGYVIGSDGKPWKYEVSVNSEKEAVRVHREARDWFTGLVGQARYVPYIFNDIN